MCNKLFDSLFLPILLYSSEVWGAYDNMDHKKWEKDSIERLHSQFYKHYLGLNRRAPNVASRNEMGRLSLKSTIFIKILNFRIHLEDLPENSIAKQCLQMSTQLAQNKKTSFMLSVNEILKLYGSIFHVEEQNINSPVNYSAEKLTTNLPKIKQIIINSLQMHQFDMIKSDRKLQFYSSFKTDRSSSHQLELIKNMQHRQLVAKLRSGNHDLRIETWRHCIPKVPEHL